MVDVTIDGTNVSVPEDATILQAAIKADISIPTLCWFTELNDIGACRVCTVEVEGEDRLCAACNTPVRPGMVVTTQSERIHDARETALRLLLSQHDLSCSTCVRRGTCHFQELLFEFNLIGKNEKGEIVELEPHLYAKDLVKGARAAWPECNTVQRDVNKCVKCGRCVAACDQLENIGVWAFVGSGSRSTVAVHDGMTMRLAGCTSCGQCITHCPTGALSERDDIARLTDAIADPTVTTVVQIAPATRTAWGVGLKAEEGELSVERMVAALKELGVDYVFDTSLAADLTIMEEGTELLHGMSSRERDKNGILWPLFTSCCPAWVQYAKDSAHDAMAHLSSAKSPMMMLGAVIKTWFAEKKNLQPEKIFSVALMPCVAKKDEINLPMNSHEDIPDMNAVLTTRELIRWIKASGVDVLSLEDKPLDNPLADYTGAGVIFGTTGGVMEAALRTAYYVSTGELLPPDSFKFAVSPFGGWVEASFDLKGTPLRCAVSHGLSNAMALLDAIRDGKVEYDFVEIMACPSGCAGGGGQPIDGSETERGFERGKVLRQLDAETIPLRYSHENPQVQKLYEEYFGEPCSEKSHHLLHTVHIATAK